MAPARRPRGPLLAATFAVSALALLVSLSSQKVRPLDGGDDLERETLRGRELEDLARAARRRGAAKAACALAVSQGRMGLLDAAACWLALSRQHPFGWGQFRAAFPGGSDEERHCWAVIDMSAAIVAEEDPCLAEAFRAGLERELQGHLRRGPLSLPEQAVAPRD